MGAITLSVSSCAEGFDSNEVFASSVSNTQLESPDITFSRVFNSDGSQSVKVSWPVVLGASGYECAAYDVEDPENPVELYKGVVDGTSFLFTRERNRTYQVSVKALGNTDRNNKDAETAMVASLSTYVQPITIANKDLVTEINSITSQYGDPEYIFELEGGVNYTIDGELNFGDALVTLQGVESTVSRADDGTNRPTITLGVDSYLSTYGGLTVENINFDCSSNKRKGGIIELGANPPESVKVKDGKTYYLGSPIIIQSCMFKNVHCCLFTVGNCSWGVDEVRVKDCIVQFDNDGSVWSDGSFISGYSTNHIYEGGYSWYSAIRHITVANSTVYNIQDSSKNFRMFRFSNADLSKPFSGSTYGDLTISNCTLSKTFVSKEFGNNIGKASDYVISIDNTNFYATFRIYKIKNGSNSISGVQVGTNAVCGGGLVTVENNDKTYATEEEFSFAGDCNHVLDFTQPNGGANFKANGAISSKGGDPRWR